MDIMDTCLTVILLHDYCTQTYINLHKLFTLHCNFICALSVVIIKTDDDDDDDDDHLPVVSFLLAVPNVTARPSTASVDLPTSYHSMLRYNYIKRLSIFRLSRFMKNLAG